MLKAVVKQEFKFLVNGIKLSCATLPSKPLATSYVRGLHTVPSVKSRTLPSMMRLLPCLCGIATVCFACRSLVLIKVNLKIQLTRLSQKTIRGHLLLLVHRNELCSNKFASNKIMK